MLQTRRTCAYLDCLLLILPQPMSCIFFFNDTATTEIYTLSLHDALPISKYFASKRVQVIGSAESTYLKSLPLRERRSEEHTSELQSLTNLVCRLLLEKKKALPLSLLTTILHSYLLYGTCAHASSSTTKQK